MWILRTFDYYTLRALHYSINTQTADEDEPRLGLGEIIKGFQAALNDWRLPITTLDGEKAAQWDSYDDCEYDMVVPPRAGRLFLSKWLEPDRTGMFPFLELPAELRNTVYEMVLAFPPEGMIVTNNGFQLARRTEDHHVEPVDLATLDTSHALDLRRQSQNLALVQVKKQIYAEAMPLVYCRNHFYFGDLDALVRFINALSIDRIEHLNSLAFSTNQRHFTYTLPVDFDVALRKLSNVRRLQFLEIEIYETTWFGLPRRERLACFPRRKEIKPFRTCDDIPGFEEVAEVASKAEKLKFRGECPTIRAWIEGRIDHIKKGGKAEGAAK